MFIDVNYEQGIPIIKISGELDMYDSTKMEEVFNSIDVNSHVGIDCGEISFVDSTIIGIFVRYSLSKGTNNKSVALINIKPFFTQLLELAKLKKLFEIYSTVENFITDFKAK